MIAALIATGIVLLVFIYLLFAAKSRQQQLESQHRQMQDRAVQLESQQLYLESALKDRQRQLQEAQDQLERLNEEYALQKGDQGRLLEQNKYLQLQLSEERQRLIQQQEDSRHQFENIANQLLHRISGNFMEQNQSKLDDLLKPLSDKIDTFRSSVQQSLVAETTQRTELRAELQRLLLLNQTLTKEANNLTNALKADTKKQGSWGEVILEKVLEASGLEKGIHYFTQDSRYDAEGQLRRPDMVLHLPEDRRVIIDSKVSLKAYEQYCSAEDDISRQQFLKQHLASVKNHVNELSAKAYQSLYNNTTDFVLLFIPVEPAYALAILQPEEDLYDFAFRKRIILVSVPSLLATLKVIENMWRLEKQNRNAQEIVRQGGALYDKFVGFVNDLDQVNNYLGKTRDAYDEAMKKLTSGSGNLVGRAEKMRKLGVDNKKKLPEIYVQEAPPENGSLESGTDK
ncbi:DNA recombination protein RmuC [Chitinophaga sp. sic0106]|uniref:DNA recombination protein RmuC n=1 Tax=Chitinophaga sp. sic0106 TaxID=2854785 RepID=UPI001C44AD2B|nr:DNA recombination protein RmuC [Chitinophaga sp. sic0106]MBV7528738.1 DNA recombination protein RmuC [Chitinophaga sp. sic0106]